MFSHRLNLLTRTLIVLSLGLLLNCSKETTSTKQSGSNSQNVNTKTNSAADSTTAATPGNKDSIVEGAVAEELDQVVREVSGRGLSKSLSSFISMLSEGHAPPQRSAKMNATQGGFAIRGRYKSGKQNCEISAFSDAEISIESNGEGSDARIASPLNYTFVKLYNDLSLQKSGVVLKKGSVLKREANGWVAVKDKEAEKRLDENHGEGTRAIQLHINQ